MFIIQIVLLAFGLSADAFAVSITNGMSLKKPCKKQALKIAFMFGLFQALMPLLGFLLGMVFVEFIDSFAHYIAFVILAFIGGRMIYEAQKDKKNSAVDNIPENLSLKVLLMQAVATSIDALVAGVSFIAMGVRGGWIFPAIALIGVITFVMSFVGVGLGVKVGGLMGAFAAKVAGGLVLIAIGAKVLLEGLLT
ncbi:MAG: manganese efflux pump MntP family protein [Oscillospiraceae bacterium]|nr:manganese efflux pump MntP family protein [Oscillospiraceae bacterium]